MADFTGDTHPDLATVEVDRFDSSAAHYWIEIRLTEGGHQFLRLTAPFGGLLITPKDVTGDGNLDLIVRSARSHAPWPCFSTTAAVISSRADTGSIRKCPADGPISTFAFDGATDLPGHDLCLCLESYAAECPTGSFRHLRERQGLASFAKPDAASQPFLSFAANRAPPSLA